MTESKADIFAQIQDEQQAASLGITRTVLAQSGAITLERDLVLAVQGVRRCGKSTLLRQIARHHGIEDQAIFVNFEDPRLGDRLDHTLLEEIVRFHESRSKKNLYYFFDEIQNVKGWERWLHVQLESKRRYFVITGSNSTLLSGKLGSSLTGRHLTLELFPFSFEEFKKLHPDSGLEQFLRLGGFPRALTHSQPDVLLREYFTDIIERDVRRHVAARSATALVQVAKAVFESTATETSYRSLARAFESTPDTVRTYVDAFEAAYLCLACPYFTYSERKRVVRPRKYYAIDLGMRAAVTTKTGLDLGKKLETAVFHALKRKYRTVYYWRDKGEVDFVVETAEGIMPIQVSWDGLKDRHFRAADEFKQAHPKSLPLVAITRENAEQHL